MTFTRSVLRLISALAMLGMVLASGPLVQAQSTPATTGGTLTGAFDQGPGGCPECFNPLNVGAGFTWFEKYFSKLVLYNVEMTELQGDLAESWEVSEDGLTVTLHLRDGVTWHDGEAFTGDDVKFTIEFARDPGSASWIGAKFNDITDIAVPDPLTVVLTQKTPNAGIMDALTFLVMLPEHELADQAPADMVASDWWKTTPIGTGPFMWAEYKSGEYVKLDAFDDYWRGRPQLDSLINRYYPEAGSSVIALRSNEIQFTYLSYDEAVSLEGESALATIQAPSQVPNYFGFDLTDPRFQDVRVRQAFMYAIDRTAIVDQLYGGQGAPLMCALSKAEYVPDGLNDYAYDPDQAASLLEEADWASIKGEPIEILTYYNDQLSNDVLVTIQQYLADVGIEVTIRAVDTPTFNETMNTTDWSIFYGGGGNGPDPDITRPYFTGPPPPDGVNRVQLESPEMDDLYARGQQEFDPAARAAIYQDACAWQNENLPWAFMWEAERFGAVSTTVQNFVWTPAPGGGRYYDAAELWTIDS